ncbi:uncharacterized protein PV06_02737 [Exophiala oligosperma]|uniref:Glycoside hydrolase family 43 protein n=1 Tax=Exophiala oligosperma TaxID=215243 RepID=A0A0D2EGQ7_9EURO|nr:uncharacterized protein PV06_02737 [Exophiala oligosperma]KIW47139.1 hypothetical protein PV06_02737 [Exophiala oligosperma]
MANRPPFTMAAATEGILEKQPLLPHPSRPGQGFGTHSLHKESVIPHAYTEQRRQSTLSTRTKIIILAMVAIPAYLLASSAVTSLGPLWPRDAVIRSPDPAPEPQLTGAQTDPASGPFASVMGPLVSSNFPDPAIIVVDGVSYAFATNNRGVGSDMVHVQVATSQDNQTWSLLEHHDALPDVGAWQTGARVWAPDVVQVDDGSFVLYYADEVTWSTAHHCVGAAVSKDVLGPYIPQDQPFACPDVTTQGGAIDPDGFLDVSTNKRYVVYKVDGNSIGHGGSCGNTVEPIVPTPLMLQEVGPDGISHIGDPVAILDRDVYDGPLIEAPTLHRSDEGVYFLFFSSNCFTTPKYDVSYATASDIHGPYTRCNRPLLVTSDADLVGPGGLDILIGGDLVVFHGHMTINNDPAQLKKAQAISASTGKPVKDVNLPLIRGMWSGTATFSGTSISLG